MSTITVHRTPPFQSTSAPTVKDLVNLGLPDVTVEDHVTAFTAEDLNYGKLWPKVKLGARYARPAQYRVYDRFLHKAISHHRTLALAYRADRRMESAWCAIEQRLHDGQWVLVDQSRLNRIRWRLYKRG